MAGSTVSATSHPLAAPATTNIVLAMFVVLGYVAQAITDSDGQLLAVHAAVVTAVFIVVARDPNRPLAAPTLPARWRGHAPALTSRPWLEAIAVTGAAVFMISCARAIGALAELIWPVGSEPLYNDAVLTGDSLGVDLASIYTAAVGEELLFRLALLVVIATWLGPRSAVFITSVVWALAHTGFDNGYPAAIVVGLVAAGLGAAAITLATRSLWPAIVAHALHNLSSVLRDHDVPGGWVVGIVYGLAGGAFALSGCLVFSHWRESRRPPATPVS